MNTLYIHISLQFFWMAHDCFLSFLIVRTHRGWLCCLSIFTFVWFIFGLVFSKFLIYNGIFYANWFNYRDHYFKLYFLNTILKTHKNRVMNSKNIDIVKWIINSICLYIYIKNWCISWDRYECSANYKLVKRRFLWKNDLWSK